VEKLHPEIAARALQLLSKVKLESVQDISEAAAAFYAWASFVDFIVK
jgi:hypothetical protein